MNKFILICSAFLLISPSVSAQQYTVTGECYRNVEQYIPSYTTPDGRYVRGYVKYERKAVPCGNIGHNSSTQQNFPKCTKNNTILGGLLGGGVAAAVSKKDAYGWAIPLGAVLGVGASRVNCE